MPFWGKRKSPLAVTYFPKEFPPQYRQRWSVSLPCSGWERVVPLRSNHQKAVFTRKTGSETSSFGPIWACLIKACLEWGFKRGLPFCVDIVFSLVWVKASTISTAQLNISRCVHPPPIKQVVFLRSYSLSCDWDGRSHLEASFALRCFQRLSLTDIATQPAPGGTADTPAVCPSRSSRTRESSSQISCAHNG